MLKKKNHFSKPIKLSQTQCEIKLPDPRGTVVWPVVSTGVAVEKEAHILM